MDFNIRVENGVKPFGEYRKTLRNRVTEIFNKLKIENEKIEWVIFDADTRNKNKHHYLMPMFIPRSGCDFGFCPPGTNEVWISTISLQSVNPYLFKLPGPRTLDTLTEVIADELAHIVTQQDHGTKEYDELHSKYIRTLQT